MPYNVYMKKHPMVFDEVPFMYGSILRGSQLNCSVQKKDMQLGYGIEMMFVEIMPKLQHGNDGLIFTSLAAPYICGTDDHVLVHLYPTLPTLI
jgi:mRNA capping enzyme, catalytic domain